MFDEFEIHFRAAKQKLAINAMSEKRHLAGLGVRRRLTGALSHGASSAHCSGYVLYRWHSMYDVGTNPSIGCDMRRTRVQPSPWSNSIMYSSSPSYIGIDPSLVAANRSRC